MYVAYIYVFISQSSSKVNEITVYKAKAFLDIQVQNSGNITCNAFKKGKLASATRRLLVYEIENGFGVKNSDDLWFSQNDDATVTCIASKYDFESISWIGKDNEDLNSTG